MPKRFSFAGFSVSFWFDASHDAPDDLFRDAFGGAPTGRCGAAFLGLIAQWDSMGQFLTSKSESVVDVSTETIFFCFTGVKISKRSYITRKTSRLQRVFLAKRAVLQVGKRERERDR